MPVIYPIEDSSSFNILAFAILLKNKYVKKSLCIYLKFNAL